MFKRNKWFYFNFIVFLFAMWKVFNSGLYSYIIFGALGLCFILFNWTRHAMFSTLRSSMERKRKVKYANISKRILPFHKWTGTTALILIIIHGTIALRHFGFNLANLKVVSGLLTGTTLIGVVLFGWLRFFKPTIKKRYIHLYLGMTMFFLIIVHLLF